MADPVSRFEFDALAHRIDTMDARGTAGAGSFQVRLEAVERDLAALRAQTAAEKHQRAADRRWLIGAVFGAVATIAAVVSLLATYVFHVH